MRSRAQIAALLAAQSSGAAAEPDPLAAFDDDLAADDPQWTELEPAIASVSWSGGETHYTHAPQGSIGPALWYDGFDGALRYLAVTGDFDASIDMRVSNGTDTGPMPVTGYRIGAFQAHDPDRATQRNYVSVGLGAIALADLRAEWKSTVDDESDSGVLATGDFGSISHPSGEGRLRILRVGALFRLFVDATELLSVTRADLPATLQVGFCLYTNQTGDPDSIAHARDFTLRTP